VSRTEVCAAFRTEVCAVSRTEVCAASRTEVCAAYRTEVCAASRTEVCAASPTEVCAVSRLHITRVAVHVMPMETQRNETCLHPKFHTPKMYPDRLCGLVVRVCGCKPQGSWVRLPVLPDFVSNIGSGTGCTQLHEDK
jgi:hypothetical protein